MTTPSKNQHQVPYVKLAEWLPRHPQIKLPAFALASALYGETFGTSVYRGGVRQLAKRAGISYSIADRHLDSLIQAGLVVTHDPTQKRGAIGYELTPLALGFAPCPFVDPFDNRKEGASNLAARAPRDGAPLQAGNQGGAPRDGALGAPRDGAEVPRETVRSNHEPFTNQPNQQQDGPRKTKNSQLTKDDLRKLAEHYQKHLAGKSCGSGETFSTKTPTSWPVADLVSVADLVIAMRKFPYWGERHTTANIYAVAARIAKGNRKEMTGHTTSQSWSGPVSPVHVEYHYSQGWMGRSNATHEERLRQQIGFMLAGYGPGEHLNVKKRLGINTPASRLDPEHPDETYYERDCRKLDELVGPGTAAAIGPADLTQFFSPTALDRMKQEGKIHDLTTPRILSHPLETSAV